MTVSTSPLSSQPKLLLIANIEKGKKRSGPKDEPQKPEEKKPRKWDEGGGGAGVGMNTSMAV